MGIGIPKLYIKFWWQLFLAMKFTFLFLNLAKIQIFIQKRKNIHNNALGKKVLDIGKGTDNRRQWGN